MAKVIALAGWSPEVLAYAFAKYSRSNLSIAQSIGQINDDKAGKFLDTFYFAYGHRSIGDNAHIPLACEDISEIAAFELEDEQLWDGQERSTRYQDFSKSSSYFIPDSVLGLGTSNLLNDYTRICSFLMEKYAEYSKGCFDWLVAHNPRPESMERDAYERTIKARAFDVARYWLFNGISTNVGQITSTRTLEDQISRLLSSEYQELRELGERMKLACVSKPLCPDEKNEPPIAPTLVKYANQNEYRILLRKKMRVETNRLFDGWQPIAMRYVKLAPQIDLVDEIVATLLYEACNFSYCNILKLISTLSESEKQRIIKLALEDRGQHDPLPKAFASGYQLQFEIAMDRGGERDLHRHRNCIQIHQPLTTARGWDVPALVSEMSLADDFNDGMSRVSCDIENLRKSIGVDANYLIPFAFRSSTLYKMHVAEAAYISELRSKPSGHFSYREIACQMHEQLIERLPELAGSLRVTPFEQQDILKR